MLIKFLFMINIFLFKINGIININSISNKIKMIIIYRKFIDIFIFLLFKLLKPHSILLNMFFFFLKLFIKKYINLIIIKLIIIIVIEFIQFIFLKLIIFNIKNTYDWIIIINNSIIKYI